jgi:UDP-N-acetylmuramate--alanine ligase
MGIGGQGISAVAQMAHRSGNHVTGCDRAVSATTRAMEQAGIPVAIRHDAAHLEGIDVLVISPAVTALDPDNAELLAAHQRGIVVKNWQEMLGELMRGKCVLSVSGVHGKGTATSMLALMLVNGGLDPTCEIGAVVPHFGANYRLGQGQYFVNEADEYNHNFWHYHPRLAVVKSIEFEHPEFFKDYDAYLNAFEQFIRGMDMQGGWPLPPTLVLNVDSQGCLDLRARLRDWSGRVITYSAGHALLPEDAVMVEAFDIRLDGETSFRVHARGSITFPEDLMLHLQLPGAHNIENALAALTVARLIGVDASVIARTLEQFEGTRRRFEIRRRGTVARQEDIILVDDYAHHPTAIAATLAATRRRYPGRRLVAAYQPHMYSRTKAFFDQFLQSFDAADVVLLADIYPAREKDTGLIHARDLVAALAQRSHFAPGAAQVLYSGSVEATTQLLASTLRAGDIVVIMGAGDIYKVTEQLLQAS